MDPVQNQTQAPVAAEQMAPPTAPVSNVPMPQEGHTSTGPIIGSIIIVLILILGGLYYYGQQMMSIDSRPPIPTETVNEANTDQAVAKLQAQGNTDDLSSIKADIQSADTSAIDSDTANVKATLSQ